MNHYVFTLNKFYDYLESYSKKNSSMIIGHRITNPIDMERNLKFDIGMDNYDPKELKIFFESPFIKSIPYFVFNMDFNCFCVLSKGIIIRYNNINKLNTIVFDSSTFKFLSNIKLIALFYYLILEENGSIYIESNSPLCVRYVIINQKELLELIAKNNKNGFHFQSGYILPKIIESSLDYNSKKLATSHIITEDKIYLHNIEFLTKWFYGSNVELLDNSLNSYPIINERYPVTKYYKITKKKAHNEILSFISCNIKEYDAGLSLKSTTIMRM